MSTLNLLHPFTAMVAGPTGSGKTMMIARLLSNMDELISPVLDEVIFCFSEWQPLYGEIKRVSKKTIFIEGLPDVNALAPGLKRLIIIDDQMNDVDKRITDIFVKGSHHRDISIIHIVQNIFSKHKEQRTINLNTQYLFLFKNPRDVSQVFKLASQMYPRNREYFLQAYKMATSRPYGYLFLDLRQETDDELRLRTNIFPGEETIVYIPLKR